jgi:hypothetical protein
MNLVKHYLIDGLEVLGGGVSSTCYVKFGEEDNHEVKLDLVGCSRLGLTRDLNWIGRRLRCEFTNEVPYTETAREPELLRIEKLIHTEQATFTSRPTLSLVRQNKLVLESWDKSYRSRGFSSTFFSFELKLSENEYEECLALMMRKPLTAFRLQLSVVD